MLSPFQKGAIPSKNIFNFASHPTCHVDGGKNHDSTVKIRHFHTIPSKEIFYLISHPYNTPNPMQRQSES